MGGYELFLIGVAAILLIAGWLVLRFTRVGLIARGTMQNADDGGRAGRQPAAVYAVDLRRRRGAVGPGRRRCWRRSPASCRPSGAAYIAKAFITVITGGAAILSGTLSASALLGTINSSAPSPPRRCSARWRCWWRRSSCCACCRRASPAASSGGRCDQGRACCPCSAISRSLAAGLAVLLGLPALPRPTCIINADVFASFAVLALSLALIWGFAGILCFGQAAFFGLGGYTYAIAAINIGDSTVPAVLVVLLPAAVRGA